MQERVRLVNGTFSIESGSGRGTRVRVQIPFDTQSKRATPAVGSGPAGSSSVTPTNQPMLHENDIRAAC
jgi:hypothetical protein